MFKTQLTIAFLFSAYVIFAQTAPSIAFSNKPFEIGLDVVAPLTNDQGFAFLLKQRISKPVQKKWEKQNSLRLLTTIRQNYRTSSFTSLPHGDSVRLIVDTTNYKRINVGLGFERQLLKKRMRFSFGGDIIYEYGRSKRQAANYTQKGGITNQTYASSSKGNNYSLGFSILGGFNYYMLTWLSIGTEIHLPLLIQKTSSKSATSNGYVESSGYIFRGGASVPRLFYLGFHF